MAMTAAKWFEAIALYESDSSLTAIDVMDRVGHPEAIRSFRHVYRGYLKWRKKIAKQGADALMMAEGPPRGWEPLPPLEEIARRAMPAASWSIMALKRTRMKDFDVLRLIARGLTDAEIIAEGISASAVASSKRRLYQRFGARNRVELALAFWNIAPNTPDPDRNFIPYQNTYTIQPGGAAVILAYPFEEMIECQLPMNARIRRRKRRAILGNG